MDNLKEQSIDRIVEYDILDVFIPLFSLRHLPRIMKERDGFIRKCEIGYFALINVAQMFMYRPLVN